MAFEAQWKRHVGKVSATLRFFCVEVHPDELTKLLGIQPTETSYDHSPAMFTSSGLQGGKNCGLWSYDTSGLLGSHEISEHLRHLLKLFLPLKSRIEELRPRPWIRIDIHWESTIAGIAGPHIQPDCLVGLGELGATLDIRVTKIDDIDDA
jgi:hypothetical protein